MKIKHFFLFIVITLVITSCIHNKKSTIPNDELLIATGSKNYPLPEWPFPITDKEQLVKGNKMYINIKNKADIITRTDFYSIPSMILKEVKITFENPPKGQVLCYAAYSKYGNLYAAEKDLNGKIVFVRLYEEDTPSSYAKHTFSKSNNTYCCTVFEKLDTIDSVALEELDALFVFIVTTENGDARGITFKFDGNRP